MHQHKYFLKLDKEAFIKKAFVQYLRYGTTTVIPSSICETSWQNPKPEYFSKAAWQEFERKIEYSSEPAWQRSEPEYFSKAAWQKSESVPEYYIWRTSRNGRVRSSHADNMLRVSRICNILCINKNIS